jgi:hypothetical protein
LPATRRNSTNHKTVFDTNRARVTNGKCLLPHVDGRSAWARRFRDIVGAYAADQGGDDGLSEGRRSIIRRCACLQTELELLETRFALAGGAEAGDLDLYQRTAGNLRRLLEALGLDRQPKDITPDLASYIASKEAVDA